ncbi:TIGR03943 family putative permease subunit [Paenibacillus sp. MBLB4367]|uniref:TIGR03943 family putative permease subunit n=1 Tax=Paenibacillus sp. MBLB4367 TaxID=3384767 RepID=UPI0039082642
MEIVQSVDLFSNNFLGKKIELSGFVYRENDMKPEQFVIARFGVSCCSADASPFGVMVESAMAINLPKDSWVKIKGIIGKTTYNQNEIMKIDAQSVAKIKAPNSPYVYPNPDFYDTYE